ncbi:23S rRNA (adenine(2503)-C(2))-methyltransferase RlmN [Gehongia tenuis]|uniref:Probable dual-specificity RNA methyltransferase RlmN n=1 Tax=Gehongia tenuis TaxID=2763655 RepID=A0A926D3D4_9FIRM|nr:23S rRNA (adenine(2503)-C(2))-methyltransferase RlmN [Gehongia tenuis]MBC8530767.1 23S rRNA (adenine(2503)-C(2))-methyltransferase RlmN [Gehongia tenuis]
MKKAMLDMTLPELQWAVKELGQPAYRAKQLREWLSRDVDFEGMAVLPKTFRTALSEHFRRGGVKILEKRVSEIDGTTKYLFLLEDHNIIEGVYMPYHYGNTLCISTQVGCRMGCAFCASTLEGCVRNLEADEMLGEVLAVNADKGGGDRRGVTNIVLMGSGEPLDNYDNVVRFLRRVHDPDILGVSYRNISLSTCGLTPRMEDFLGEELPVTLCVSLHGPDDETRQRLIPAAKAYPLTELMAVCRKYVERTGRRFIFEYALVKGINDGREAALKLARLLRGFQCHVNVIPLNEVSDIGLAGPSPEGVRIFLETLEAQGISATRRRTMGADIAGACGQLRRSKMKNEGERT